MSAVHTRLLCFAGGALLLSSACPDPSPPPPPPPLRSPPTPLPEDAEVEPAWPIERDLYPYAHEVEQIDRTGDGVVDHTMQASGGGSGFHGAVECVRDGRTGHRACEETASTPYSHFSGFRVVAEPPEDNTARKALEDDPCHLDMPRAPEHAAMWLLQVPKTQTSAQELERHPGKPQTQVSVCMSTTVAAGLLGGLGWYVDDDTGDLEPVSSSKPPPPSAGWRVYYAAGWYEKTGQRTERPVELVIETKVWALYRHRHALAVHDKKRDEHVWVRNYAASMPEAFKLDRWETIETIAAAREGKVRVVLSDQVERGRVEQLRPERWLRR